MKTYSYYPFYIIFCTMKWVTTSFYAMSFKKQYFKTYWVSPCKYFLLVYTARNETQVIFGWKRHPVVYRLQLSRWKYRPRQSKCTLGLFPAHEWEGEVWTVLSTYVCGIHITKTKLKWGFCSFCCIQGIEIYRTVHCLCSADNWCLMALFWGKLHLN